MIVDRDIKRILNIEQGISKSEVEIAALSCASLAMTEGRERKPWQ